MHGFPVTRVWPRGKARLGGNDSPFLGVNRTTLLEVRNPDIWVLGEQPSVAQVWDSLDPVQLIPSIAWHVLSYPCIVFLLRCSFEPPPLCSMVWTHFCDPKEHQCSNTKWSTYKKCVLQSHPWNVHSLRLRQLPGQLCETIASCCFVFCVLLFAMCLICVDKPYQTIICCFFWVYLFHFVSFLACLISLSLGSPDEFLLQLWRASLQGVLRQTLRPGPRLGARTHGNCQRATSECRACLRTSVGWNWWNPWCLGNCFVMAMIVEVMVWWLLRLRKLQCLMNG